MILNRLYELAVREQLLSDPAFEEQAVPFVVQVGAGGTFLGIDGERPRPPKKGESRAERKLSIPRPHGSAASQGFARYFADTLARVLPVVFDAKNAAKDARSRETFWRQIDTAADATDDNALRAVQAFGRQREDKEFAESIRRAVAATGATGAERVTFAYYPDRGPTILDREPVRNWYATHFRRFTAEKQESGPVGFCTITGRSGPLPTSHALALSGVPGGLPTGVKIVSLDKPAFQHHGLDGAANAAIGYEAADGYARGFQWLRARRDHHFVVGGTLFLFWTRRPVDLGDMNALGQADPDQVKRLLEGTGQGKECGPVEDANDFYLLAVSGNAARVVVRDYLERPLGQVRENIRRWFADLRIADTSKQHQGRPNAAFPLWLLANATALEADRVAPDIHARLMCAALTGGPVPDSLLIAAVGRLWAEGHDAFRPPRMGLIKLCLTRKGVPVTETLNADEQHSAYVYGRLLEVFAQIQYAALGDVNANVVDKFYGTFSAAPAMVFGRLVANAQNHLRKIRGEKPGTAVALEQRLMEIRQLLTAAPPPPQFSLQDQGRFALGYYHEKAKRFGQIAEKKAEKVAKAKADAKAE
ncbi:type I-C CRISPR-associated protein Cas8c/Csd1 [Gemmata sp. G18]|uniref:Type I-C CRISPR-associated protein Cas8c/Csd1 n=1 Tax=Gemmata palustris TaxID=2822762 RepID=A0ABS5BT28_9BACT|nr:type I-C CRISPR-associated protein Cas8c/Csd1 [Gemmata palustris]MBP3956883.1 type I-C CRISPR-associated protein Cas8c/Csd1 [Gemmata palustris]